MLASDEQADHVRSVEPVRLGEFLQHLDLGGRHARHHLFAAFFVRHGSRVSPGTQRARRKVARSAERSISRTGPWTGGLHCSRPAQIVHALQREALALTVRPLERSHSWTGRRNTRICAEPGAIGPGRQHRNQAAETSAGHPVEAEQPALADVFRAGAVRSGMGKLRGMGMLVLLSACGGGDDETVKDRLIGSWSIDVSGSSFIFCSFDEDGSYTYNTLQNVGANSAQLQVVMGKYYLRQEKTGLSDDNGDYLLLMPVQATCSSGVRGAGGNVAFSDGTIVFSTENGITIMERVPEERANGNNSVGGGLAAQFGCFTADGFVPFPLTKL